MGQGLVCGNKKSAGTEAPALNVFTFECDLRPVRLDKPVPHQVPVPALAKRMELWCAEAEVYAIVISKHCILGRVL